MKKIALFISLLLFISFPNLTFAQNYSSDTGRTPQEIREAIQEKRIELQEKRAEVSENIKDRLDDRRLKQCLVKEKVIQNRTKALNKLSENILDKFTAISDRVQNYYTQKVVPSGETLDNYDELLADVDAKKIVVLAALENAKANSAEFTCDSDNPKGQLTDFRVDMQEVKSALKEYRTSIKNLIVAVKSVMKENENAE